MHREETRFYKVRMVHPKSLGMALGFVAGVIYVATALFGLFVAFIWRTGLVLNAYLSLASGAVLVPAFFFVLGILIGLVYNAYAGLTGGIAMEVETWNP